MNLSWANEIVKEMVDYLSITIAAMSIMLDPSIIVLGGRLSESLDVLIEPIKANLEGTLPIIPTIRASNLGSKATVLGTIMLVFDGTFENRLS